LTGLRAVAVIGFLLVSRLKNVSFSKSQDEACDQQALQPELPQESRPTLGITPELLNELRVLLYQTTVSEDQTRTPGTPQLTEIATATDQQENQPVSLFSTVPITSLKTRGTKSLKPIFRAFPGEKSAHIYAGVKRNTPPLSSLFSTLTRNRNTKRGTLRNNHSVSEEQRNGTDY